MVPLLLALHVALRPAGAVLPDSGVRARVDSAILRFQLEWRDAWAESQGQFQKRIVLDSPHETRLRVVAAHCHFVVGPFRGALPILSKHLIRNSEPAQAVCPVWYPEDASPTRDERDGIDGSLTMTRRWRIRELRRGLRLLLDSVAHQLPNDEWIAAQRVRFAVDDGDQQAAIDAAVACRGPEGYCGMLRGFVLHRAGLSAAADSAFADALAMMPPADRCAWNDLRVLLPEELAEHYASTPCEERRAFETRVWWLSDPLWSEPGNERRAEQFARKVLITMLAPLGVDERQHWRPKKGGEAVAEMLLRYGWPTQFHWEGPYVDEGHDGWLLQVAGADTATPYVVREYSRDRLHTVPSAKALREPLSAAPEDWTLSELARDRSWWPREHFRRDAGSLVQLQSLGQHAMLRRQHAVRYALAVDLDTSLTSRSGREPTRSYLFEARTPDSTRSVVSAEVRAGRTVVLAATLAPGPTLLGLEVRSDGGRRAGRTRFSTTIVPPLSALAGGRAVSPAVFIDATPPEIGALDADAAVARMLGSTTLRRQSRTGVYWEGYGFSRTDTVEITLSLQREGRPGLFERVTSGFGLWGDDGGQAEVRWTEFPGSGRTLTKMEGDVPVQMRSVSLDLRRQRGGRYRLEISMRTPTGAAVTSERVVTLR
jgi:hypothetical protein